MQLRKFYGRTLSGAMIRVKRELGPEAVILESRRLEPGSPDARLNPGMVFEISAAGEGAVTAAIVARPVPAAMAKPYRPVATQHPLETNPASLLSLSLQARIAATARQTQTPEPKPAAAPRLSPREVARQKLKSFGGAVKQAAPAPATVAAFQTSAPRPALLDDLGLLKDQLRSLLSDLEAPARPESLAGDLASGAEELRDYHAMIEAGVDHAVLAGPFRRWLQWRTASPVVRRYIVQSQPQPAALMRGAGFREWLWLEWLQRQGKSDSGSPAEAPAARFQALVGPAGAGKTTTLAKLAARMKRERGGNIAIVNLDAMRFGAVDQWRRLGKLIGLHVAEVGDEDQLRRAMAVWEKFDWVGIDTPGNLERNETARRLLGAIHEFEPGVETLLALPAGQQECDSRACMRRGGPGPGIAASRKLVFTKLDTAARPGSMLNLTMDGGWGIHALTDGPRVPEDYRVAAAPALWDAVFAAEGHSVRAGACS